MNIPTGKPIGSGRSIKSTNHCKLSRRLKAQMWIYEVVTNVLKPELSYPYHAVEFGASLLSDTPDLQSCKVTLCMCQTYPNLCLCHDTEHGEILDKVKIAKSL